MKNILTKKIPADHCNTTINVMPFIIAAAIIVVVTRIVLRVKFGI